MPQDLIKLRIVIDPVAKGRPRFARSGHAYTPHKTRVFESTVKQLLRSQYKGKPLSGAIQVDIIFTIQKPKSVKRAQPTVKPDVENLSKAFCDAANEVLWGDDSQICCLSVEKQYGALGCIEVEVRELLLGNYDPD